VAVRSYPARGQRGASQRAAGRLPARAAGGLFGATTEALRMRSAGPLWEAVRRTVSTLRERWIWVARDRGGGGGRLGDLSGRPVQAVLLDRVDASPVQVQAADRLLAEHPLGTPPL